LGEVIWFFTSWFGDEKKMTTQQILSIIIANLPSTIVGENPQGIGVQFPWMKSFIKSFTWGRLIFY
jgi:hypothetical protein